MAKTVIGLYDNLDEAHETVQELVRRGIARADISIAVKDETGLLTRHVGSEGDQEQLDPDDLDYLVDEAGDEAAAAKGMEIGAALGGIAGLLMGLGVPTLPGLGPVLAAGPLLAMLSGTGIGAVTGGMIGALTRSGVENADANVFAEGIRRGGTLVMVDASDDMADRAAQIMNQYHPMDLEERLAGWQKDHWQGFRESGESFAFDQPDETTQQQANGSNKKSGSGARVYPGARPSKD